MIGIPLPVNAISPCCEHNQGTVRHNFDELTCTRTRVYEWACGCLRHVVEPEVGPLERHEIYCKLKTLITENAQ